jgi:hypothetical protein
MNKKHFGSSYFELEKELEKKYPDLRANARAMLLNSIDNLKKGKAGGYFNPEEDPGLLERAQKDYAADKKGVERRRNRHRV